MSTSHLTRPPLALATCVAYLAGCQLLGDYAELEPAGAASSVSAPSGAGGSMAGPGSGGAPSGSLSSAGGTQAGSGSVASSGAGGDGGGSASTGSGTGGDGGGGGAAQAAGSATISSAAGGEIGPFPLCEGEGPRRWAVGATRILATEGSAYGVAARDGRALIVYGQYVNRAALVDRDGILSTRVIDWYPSLTNVVALEDGRFAATSGFGPEVVVLDPLGGFERAIALDTDAIAQIVRTPVGLLAVDDSLRWAAVVDVDAGTAGPWKAWGPVGDPAPASVVAADGVGLALHPGGGATTSRGQLFDGEGDPIGSPVDAPANEGARGGWSCGDSCWIVVPGQAPIVRAFVGETLTFDTTLPNLLAPTYDGARGFSTDGCRALFVAERGPDWRRAIIESALDGSWMVEVSPLLTTTPSAAKFVAPLETGRALVVEGYIPTTWRWMVTDDGGGGAGGSGGGGGAESELTPGQEPWDGTPQACVGSGTWREGATLPPPSSSMGEHAIQRVLPLSGGRVLVVSAAEIFGDVVQVLDVDVYDPALDTWERIALEPPPLPRLDQNLVELLDGRILMTGGRNEYPQWEAQIWDLEAATTMPAGSGTARANHFAGVTSDGVVILAGGEGVDVARMPTQTCTSTPFFDCQPGPYQEVGAVTRGTTYGSSVLIAGSTMLLRSDGPTWSRAVLGDFTSSHVTSLDDRVALLDADRGLALWRPGTTSLDFVAGATPPGVEIVAVADLCDAVVAFTTERGYHIELDGTSTPFDLPVVGPRVVRLASGELFAIDGRSGEVPSPSAPRRTFLFRP